MERLVETEEALRQIDEKGYARPYGTDGRKVHYTIAERAGSVHISRNIFQYV